MDTTRISPSGKLNGAIRLPGDLGLTLSSLAFGMISGRSVTISNPSTAPDVEALRKLFGEWGARFTVTPEGFILHGEALAGDVSLSGAAPEEALHILAAFAAFSPCTVYIHNPSNTRDRILRPLVSLLHSLGLPESSITSREGSVVITGGRTALPERVTADSAWEMETILAAARASGKPVVISHPGQIASHVLKIMDALGAHAPDASRDSIPDELARRLAKISRERPREESRFDWNLVDAEIRIPGDTTLAAAAAGAAAIIARSDVILRDVLWEQGRKGFFEALRRMRANIESTPGRGYSFDAAEVRVKGSNLEGIQITPAQAQTMRSELPILGAVAVSARGETVLRDPGHCPGLGREVFRRLKTGLERLGAHIGDYREGLVIKGPRVLRGAPVESGGIPGIALALALAGMTASGETEIGDFSGDDFPLREFLEESVKTLTSRTPSS